MASCSAIPYANILQPSPFAAKDMIDFSPVMATAIRELEGLLHYKFKRVSLLEEALTHLSYSHSANYERLEFVGDAALGLAVANLLFLTYPDLDPGQLTRLRIANVSTEKLARAALKLGLHRYVRHRFLPEDALHEQIRNFEMAVERENGMMVFGGEVKPPKILADIVESVAAAVYIDCEFDLKASWPIFKHLLEPLVTLELLQEQTQPVTTLFEFCRRDGKKVDIKQSKQGKSSNIANVFVDGKHIAAAFSKQWENARILAAKIALKKLSYHTAPNPLSQCVKSAQELSDITTATKPLCQESAQESSGSNEHKIGSTIHEQDGRSDIGSAKHELNEMCEKRKWPKPTYKIATKPLSHLESAQESSGNNDDNNEHKVGSTIHEQDGHSDIGSAKLKLNELCEKRKWPKPTYKMEQQIGPGHDLRFICSVQINTASMELLAMGEEKSRIKQAENSAASFMLQALQDCNYLCL